MKRSPYLRWLLNRVATCLLSSLLLGGGLPARAAQADKDAPTTIEADKMTYDDLKQVNIFSGGVLLIKGSLVLRGDKLTMRQSPEGYQFGTAEGRPATFRQRRDGPGELYMEGEGERIDYDSKADTVVLNRRAILRKLDGTTVTDEVKGDIITYLQRTEYFTVNSAAGASPTAGGRVKAIIQPRSVSGGAAVSEPGTSTLKPDHRLRQNDSAPGRPLSP
ncbi:MAG: lipopolysaccharide transport periplasmic protein LptA [Burkholderiaceae bacterium]|jgi:lipopolysaccharide export system protein LptA